MGFWQDLPVLVTGADGFIGSHLSERLAAEGARVRALAYYNSFARWGWLDELPAAAREQVEIFPGDIRDPLRVEEAVRGQKVVFHLASLIAIPYSYHAPDSYVQTNVGGALNVLNACRRHGVERLVHTSTSEVYGSARYVPIDEKHPLQGQSPYSASKIGADALAESFWRAFGLPVAIIRPFNTFGPRQSARAVIPTMLSQLAAGAKELRLGALSPTRDFNYVADTVEGFLAVSRAEQAVGRVINVGSGRETAIGDLAAKIMTAMGRQVPIVTEEARLRPAASEVDRLLCDNTLARELAGWQPRHSLEEGLAVTAAWVAANLQHFRPDAYTI
ncbi:MAG: NAD-dependent 4,6-dehydratase LegB [Thermodesulfobacteriota bacterium]